jgi:medium-chain acyl-[acyl-carrier-protein] hydrolase
MDHNRKVVNKWIVRPQPRLGARYQLICFPQAAGNAWSFFNLAEKLPADIELYAIQYPGHGDRLGEEPLRDCHTMVKEISQSLAPELDRPYALFGHSMGAILAFETGRLLPAVGCPPAAQIVVSGYDAPGEPTIPDPSPPMHELTDAQLLERIEALECTPREVLEDPEMQTLLLRMIRADSAVCSSHTCSDTPPIKSPITAFGGRDDPRTSEEGLRRWQQYTSSQFDLQWFPGSHGFLLAHEDLFQQRLLNVLRKERKEPHAYK